MSLAIFLDERRQRGEDARMAPRLVACSTCECHVKTTDTTCPHCGAVVRVEGHREGARFPGTATAVALGLTAVLTAAGCEEPIVSPAYGIAFGGQGGTAGSGEGGMGGQGGGMGGMGGQGGGMGGMGGK